MEFTGKGLYICRANDVTISDCTFKDITASVVVNKSNEDLDSYLSAITVLKCKGNVSITDNSISNVSNDADGIVRGRAIHVDYCGGNSGSELLISGNEISDIAFNALQVTNLSFSNIQILNNTINNWDSDNNASADGLYAGGRATRLLVSNSSSNPAITISGNTLKKRI